MQRLSPRRRAWRGPAVHRLHRKQHRNPFGYCGGKLGDDDVAVAGLENRDQDLVYARVEGAATAAGETTLHAVCAAAAAVAAGFVARIGRRAKLAPRIHFYERR